jgi:pilus assembly protein Flp/PilA
MKNLLKRFKNDGSGATAIEYGLIAALIGVAIITAAGLLGDELESTFSNIQESLAGANETR